MKLLLDRFKITFGEMKYYLKNDRFTIVMEKLSQIVEFESDTTILHVSDRFSDFFLPQLTWATFLVIFVAFYKGIFVEAHQYQSADHHKVIVDNLKSTFSPYSSFRFTLRRIYQLPFDVMIWL